MGETRRRTNPLARFGLRAVTGLGHKERLPPSQLSGCCRFGTRAQLATGASRCKRRPNQFGAMAGVGHEDAFLPPRLSVRCGFTQRTFAGTRGSGREAPIADPPVLAPEWESSTRSDSFFTLLRNGWSGPNPA